MLALTFGGVVELSKSRARVEPVGSGSIVAAKELMSPAEATVKSAMVVLSMSGGLFLADLVCSFGGTIRLCLYWIVFFGFFFPPGWLECLSAKRISVLSLWLVACNGLERFF